MLPAGAANDEQIYFVSAAPTQCKRPVLRTGEAIGGLQLLLV